MLTGTFSTGLLGGASALGGASGLKDARAETRFYAPKPTKAAKKQIAELRKAGQATEAALLKEVIDAPHAQWLTGGTPCEVKDDVKRVMKSARSSHSVPVLVAYNLPYRDCSQFSAGGASSVEEYVEWIDGFTDGIGQGEAIVILEPDGLGIIPWYDPFADRDTWVSNPNYEWCQPSDADPATAAADRFAMLNYAVSRLKENPTTSVYLDATHSGWLGAGDAADRLVQAGVLSADGFFLNVSNYQSQDKLEKYGTWIAKCIWFGDPSSGSWGVGHYEWCASQYSEGVSPNDFSTWGSADQWYADNVESQTWVPYPGDAGLNSFVIDTSRNGQGPWSPTAAYPDNQDWCNPPDRGVGLLPTAETGNELIDAYLWIKVPGESDGECTRGLGPGGTTVDPEWGIVDPVAGAWFPEMALDLAKNAFPALELSCH
jgi:endoglucanase